MLEENKTIDQRTSNDFVSKIEILAKREKEQFKIAEKGKNSSKLIDEKIYLEFELNDLKNNCFTLGDWINETIFTGFIQVFWSALTLILFQKVLFRCCNLLILH